MRVVLRMCMGLLFALPWTAEAATAMKVMFDNTVLRATPSDNAAQVGVSPRYHTYASHAISGGWHKLQFNEGFGWVHESKLAVDSRALVTVTASSGNVRSGPGTTNRIVGTANNGSQWMVIGVGGTLGEWKQAYFGGAIRWLHESLLQAYDQPKSTAGFVQVPQSGEGFYAITTADKLWGLPRLVYPLMDSARQFTRDNPSWGKLGINDISLKNGGYMAPHSSHQVGDDVDIRLLRNDGVLETTDIYQPHYSRDRTKALITNYLNRFLSINVVLFGDRYVYGRLTSTRTDECTQAPVSTSLQYVACFPNHWHHLHVRVN